jgi:hypothetical protein
MIFVLLRLAYLTVTNAFAALRLLPVGDRDKNAEILALRHQITVLERQLGANRVKSAPEDRALWMPTIPSALVVAGLTSQQILFHRRVRGRPNSLIVDA